MLTTREFQRSMGAFADRPGGKEFDPHAKNRTTFEGFTRQMFNDYESRYRPVEDSILAEQGQGVEQRLADEAGARANKIADVTEGVLAREQRGLGANLDSRQQATQTRRLGLARVLGEAGSREMARRAQGLRADTSEQEAMSLQESLYGATGQGLSAASTAETNRNNQYKQDKAEKKAGYYQLAGTLAGAAVSAFIPGGALLAGAASGASKG